jgi:LPS sulfotransferase NodH
MIFLTKRNQKKTIKLNIEDFSDFSFISNPVYSQNNFQLNKKDHFLNPYPIGNNNNYKRFVIIGTNRCRSTYLTSLLRNHSNIVCYGELFHPEKIDFRYYGFPQNNAKLLSYRNKYPVEFMNKIIFRNYPEQVHSIGFKLFYDQLGKNKTKVLKDIFSKKEDVLIIHLKRRNLLKMYLSLQKANQTNKWSYYDECYIKEAKNLGISESLGLENENIPSNTPVCPLYIDTNKLIRYFNETEKQENIFDSLISSYFTQEIIYENFISDTPSHLEKIFTALSIPYETLYSPYKKTPSSALNKLIMNYDQVQKVLINTKWNNFID